MKVQNLRRLGLEGVIDQFTLAISELFCLFLKKNLALPAFQVTLLLVHSRLVPTLDDIDTSV